MTSPFSVEPVLAVVGVLLAGSALLSRASDRFGVPAMLIFLAVGMLAGSEGVGGIDFDNPWLAQAGATVALLAILFAGGLETRWAEVRPVLAPGIALATAGVLISALAVAAFAAAFLGYSLREGMLLGSIVASTDAAAVFAVLKGRSVRLREPLRPLLELESGSNDPMAIFLTTAFVGLLASPAASVGALIPRFAVQMGLGLALGVAFGWGARRLLNAARLGYEGLYPVLSLGVVIVAYGATALVGGNGFLSVYAAGVVLASGDYIHRRTLEQFHDGFAWLMQIALFLMLGLLAFPSRVFAVTGTGLAVALFLMFVARPAAVFLCLARSRLGVREKLFVSWVGLRGAVPVVLATFPMVAGLPKAEEIFNVVFFVVLLSALVQGTTMAWAARRLGLEAPAASARPAPLRLDDGVETDARLVDFILPYASPRVGKPLVALGLPKDSLIALIGRGDRFVVPDGGTRLEAGDVLWVLVSDRSLPTVRRVLTESAPEGAEPAA